MLPQGNAQPINEEQNDKNELPLPNVGTPKHNPAIAAIDRLLFYSPLPESGTVQKSEEAQEKNVSQNLFVSSFNSSRRYIKCVSSRVCH